MLRGGKKKKILPRHVPIVLEKWIRPTKASFLTSLREEWGYKKRSSFRGRRRSLGKVLKEWPGRKKGILFWGAKSTRKIHVSLKEGGRRRKMELKANRREIEGGGGEKNLQFDS